MDQLHQAVEDVHVIGERYLLVKQKIADCIEQQKRNRQAIGALKEGVQEAKLWLQRPGAIYLRLPREQCAKVILNDQELLAAKLEQLFAEQRQILSDLEAKGVEAEYITATA